MTVTDALGRRVRDAGLARWLAAVAPARVRGEVSVALVSDAHIRRLNSQYRGKNVPTDVLSFPIDPAPRIPAPASRIPHRGSRTPAPVMPLGDIVIGTGVARRQARAAGHSYASELRVLALHGLLHLLGYDHERPEDAGRMARAEGRLRTKGGLAGGLIERSTATSVAVTRASRRRTVRRRRAKTTGRTRTT